MARPKNTSPVMPAMPPVPRTAYLIAWLGELGGIQHIQITSDALENITRVGQWPMPVLVLTGEGKSFEAATKRCMEKLRIRAPSWTRFIRGPVRTRENANLGFAHPSMVTIVPKRRR